MGRSHGGWVIGLIGTCLFCLGCTAGKAEQTAGRRFAVPEAYGIHGSDRPFFLPRSNDEGFAFILNPTAALPQQILVRVEAKEDVCRRAAGTEAYVKSTVCAAQPLAWKERGLRREGNEVFWNYRLSGQVTPSTSGQAVLVSCSQISGPAKGICTAPLPFEDLVLTLHITDTEVPRLAAHYDAATALLRGWER